MGKSKHVSQKLIIFWNKVGSEGGKVGW